MRILFRIPFSYKWDTFSNIRCHYEELIRRGHDVVLNNKRVNSFNPDGFDLIMLHGADSLVTQEQFNSKRVPLLAFGWSDPNMYLPYFAGMCDAYFTNDLRVSEEEQIEERPIFYYPTSCYKNFHRTLDIDKTHEVLVYGYGDHRQVRIRNTVVGWLRAQGFKITVFGRGWDKHPDTYPFVSGEGLIQEINKAHVCLDLSDKVTAWPHRILECSACGTPVITIKREDTMNMFKGGEEIIPYERWRNIPDILNYWLQNKDLLKTMGFKAQERCYRDHDISVRVTELANLLKPLEILI